MTLHSVHLAVYDTMADWEVGHTIAHIQKNDWQKKPGRYSIYTVGETSSSIVTMGGIKIIPDMILSDLSPANSAMLILPGSDKSATGETSAFASKAKEFLTAQVPVAAICGATAALALMGMLDDRAHTSNAVEFLQYMGYKGSKYYVSEPAHTDGNLITASGVAPVDFAKHVFERLDLYEPEVLDAWYRLYSLQDPQGYHDLMRLTS